MDHVVPYDHDAAAEGRPQPGPTTTSNLAALCRHHHRLKTHTAWSYTVVGPGEFEWTSPHGHRFHRDPSGSTHRADRAAGSKMTPPRTPPLT